MDSLQPFDQWKQPERIRELAELAVMHEAVITTEPCPKESTPVTTRRIDVSSSEIRARVAAGKSIRGFVAESVERYISAAKLYSSPSSANDARTVERGIRECLRGCWRASSARGTSARRKRVQPIVDAINEEYERLQSISEEELRGQTAKFRETIREATGELEARSPSSRSRSTTTADAAEREQIDHELGGADGRGGVEGELREATAEVLDEILPEAFATVREAARRLIGTTVKVTGRDSAVEHGALRRAAHGRYPAAHGRSRRWRPVKEKPSSRRFRCT